MKLFELKMREAVYKVVTITPSGSRTTIDYGYHIKSAVESAILAKETQLDTEVFISVFDKETGIAVHDIIIDPQQESRKDNFGLELSGDELSTLQNWYRSIRSDCCEDEEDLDL